MIEINEAVRAFIDKTAGDTELSEDEYIDHSDGLIHCKKCGGRRQTILPAPLCLPLPAGGRKAEEGRRGTEGAHGEHPAQEGAGPAGPLSP